MLGSLVVVPSVEAPVLSEIVVLTFSTDVVPVSVVLAVCAPVVVIFADVSTVDDSVRPCGFVVVSGKADEEVTVLGSLVVVPSVEALVLSKIVVLTFSTDVVPLSVVLAVCAPVVVISAGDVSTVDNSVRPCGVVVVSSKADVEVTPAVEVLESLIVVVSAEVVVLSVSVVLASVAVVAAVSMVVLLACVLVLVSSGVVVSTVDDTVKPSVVVDVAGKPDVEVIPSEDVSIVDSSVKPCSVVEISRRADVLVASVVDVLCSLVVVFVMFSGCVIPAFAAVNVVLPVSSVDMIDSLVVLSTCAVVISV